MKKHEALYDIVKEMTKKHDEIKAVKGNFDIVEIDVPDFIEDMMKFGTMSIPKETTFKIAYLIIQSEILERGDMKEIEKAVQEAYEGVKKDKTRFDQEVEILRIKKELDEKESQWNLKDVEKIIKELDEKTDMEGAKIKIRQSSAKKSMGLFRYYKGGEIIDFAFSKDLLRYATEEELRDVVIHEYCHYWQLMIEGETGHNKRFSDLCRKLGGSGKYKFEEFSKLRIDK